MSDDDPKVWSGSVFVSASVLMDSAADALADLLSAKMTAAYDDMIHGPRYGPPFKKAPLHGPPSPTYGFGGLDAEWSYTGDSVGLCTGSDDYGDLWEHVSPAEARELAAFLAPAAEDVA